MAKASGRDKYKALAEYCFMVANSDEIDEIFENLELEVSDNTMERASRLTNWLMGEYDPRNFVPSLAAANETIKRRVDKRAAFIKSTCEERSGSTILPDYDIEAPHPLAALAEDRDVQIRLDKSIIAHIDTLINTSSDQQQELDDANLRQGEPQVEANASEAEDVSTDKVLSRDRRGQAITPETPVLEKLLQAMTEMQKKIEELEIKMDAKADGPIDPISSTRLDHLTGGTRQRKRGRGWGRGSTDVSEIGKRQTRFQDTYTLWQSSNDENYQDDSDNDAPEPVRKSTGSTPRRRSVLSNKTQHELPTKESSIRWNLGAQPFVWPLPPRSNDAISEAEQVLPTVQPACSQPTLAHDENPFSAYGLVPDRLAPLPPRSTPTPAGLPSSAWGEGRRNTRGEGNSTVSRESPRDAGRLIRKWGIKFSGKPQESFDYFLTRIEDCCAIDNVAKEEVLPALSELLDGAAAMWFRNERHTWRNWSDFVMQGRLWYEAGNEVQRRLSIDVQVRTQYAGEPVRNYLTQLRTIVRRLEPPWPLDQQLDLYIRNMRPELQVLIRRDEVQSIGDLVKRAVEAEQLLALRKTFREPPPPETFLLPDIAMVPEQEPKASKKTEKQETPKVAGVSTQPEKLPEGLEQLAKLIAAENRKMWDDWAEKNQAKPQSSSGKSSQQRRRKSSKSPSKKKKTSESSEERQRSGDRSTIECYNCGKLGHISRNCQQPKNDRRQA